MTTITIDRATVEKALAALDAGVPISPGSILHDWFRAALAQHVKPMTGLDKGNSPGGWIDDLRTTVKAAGGEKR